MSPDSTAATRRAHPMVTIRSSRGLLDIDLRSVWHGRELLYFLVWRELKVRYAQAALGIGWAVIQPVFAVLIFTAVFGSFARVPSDGYPYALFAFAGVLPWTYFAEAARRSALGLVGDSELIKKVYFPRLIIPLTNVLAPVVDFAIAFIVFLLVMLWYGVLPTWKLLLVIPLLAVTMASCLAIGLWLGPINVRFRDVGHTLPFLLQIWMYASPIVYPLSLVPEKWRTLYSLNPMVGVVEGFRWALLGKGDVDFFALGLSVAIIAVALAGGLVFFRHRERFFADVI
ncbi:MAG: ABC transporter permease [Burkholderiaceae bacterium]|nr:ABC transporter permease [Burkholderiaceae bacterium]